MHHRPSIAGPLVLLLGAGLAAGAEPEHFGDLDLESLMQVPVTSVEGVARPLQDTPAAVFVLTPEDIRRGGHLSVPDALRGVPGMNVAQIDSGIWAISSRGFNDRFSTKLLVRIDGRAVYNSLFSGVFWDVQDIVLEDLDRIEVVRGPGATLWGANAVNGVINIESKRARETQGLLFTTGGGNVERGSSTLRYGGRLGGVGHYRAYAKAVTRSNFDHETPFGPEPSGEWELASGGFRMDFETLPDTTVTFQGRGYSGDFDNPVGPQRIDTEIEGWHLLLEAEHLVSERAGWSVRGYFDRAARERRDFFDDRRETLDFELRHHFTTGKHALIWGAGFRRRTDDTVSGPTLAFDPVKARKDLYSAFVQDTIQLDDRLRLMLGSKFEENDYTGFEIQPGARLVWAPDDSRTLWAAISRSVREPSRGSEGLVVSLGGPARLLGNPAIDSEVLTAYEVGYRYRPHPRCTIDLAGFFNDYAKLISQGAPTASPTDVTFSNGTEGSAVGAELAFRWDVSERGRISGGYSLLEVDLDGIDESDEQTAPQHQLNLQSMWDLTEDVELDASIYYVDEVPEYAIDAYTRLDLGVVWRPQPRLELALRGQNLLESAHTEFVDPFFVIRPIEIRRSIYARATVRF